MARHKRTGKTGPQPKFLCPICGAEILQSGVKCGRLREQKGDEAKRSNDGGGHEVASGNRE